MGAISRKWHKSLCSESTPMRQLVVNYDREAFLIQSYGGITKSISKLIESFCNHSNLGIQPKITFTRCSNRHLLEVESVLSRNLKPARRFLKAQSGYSTLLTLGLVRDLSSLWAGGTIGVKRADILHATYYRPLRLERKTGRSLAVTVHDFIPEKLGWNNVRNPHLGKKSLCKKSDLIICVSQQTANELHEHYGISGDRVRVIHHGVDPSLTLGKMKSIEDLNMPSILYVGHRTGYKDFDTLVAAISILNSRGIKFLLRIVGPDLLDHERRNLDVNIGSDHWNFLANVSNEELRFFYATSTFHCVTSKLEGFGMTILESMIEGTPVFLSDIPVFHEVAGDAGNYFIPGNSESLSDAIHTIFDEKSYINYVNKSLQKAQSYSWLGMAEKYRDAYYSIMS